MKLKYLFAGAMIATVGLSILTGVVDVIDVVFEWIKGIFAVKITTLNQIISNIANDDEPKSVQAIGFAMPESGDDYDEEY